jgi:hypothetical protein
MGVSAARRLVASTALVAALAACGGPDVSPTPSGDPFERPQGDEATGPVVELDAETVLDTSWRYGTYPTDDGPCVQIDVDGEVSARCDDVLPAEGQVFGGLGQRASPATGATVVDGVVAEGVQTVWLIGDGNARTPAIMMPLEDDGIEGTAFVGVLPADVTLTHLQAVAFNGDVLETLDLR